MRSKPSRVEEIPYAEDSFPLFAGLAPQPWSVFLDSGHPYTEQGRFDIIAAAPSTTLTTWGGSTEIRDRQGIPGDFAFEFFLHDDLLEIRARDRR